MLSRIAVASMALLFLGCPPPTILHVFNNTSQTLEYCRGHSCEAIAPGEAAKVSVPMNGYDFSFSLRAGGALHEYHVPSVRHGDYAWPLNTGNHFHVYAQVQPDLSVLLLPPNSPLPASVPSTQPEGFPLLPLKTPAA